jgi:hypothetical protein
MPLVALGHGNSAAMRKPMKITNGSSSKGNKTQGLSIPDRDKEVMACDKKLASLTPRSEG